MNFILRKPLVAGQPMRQRFVFLMSALIAVSSCSTVSANEPLPYWHSSLSHKAWARPEGAPSAANAIVQDDTGMLWFAAANGLYRFDGASFERVDDVAGNKLLSPNVQALSIFGDEFWLGYTFGGISVFKHGAVRHYGVADGLPSASINRFGKTADGTIWTATPSATYWLDGARWRKVLPADGVPEGEQSNFSVLQDGTLLINHAQGLYRSVPGTHRFRHVNGPDGVVSSQVNADGKVILMRLSTTHYQFDPSTETATPLRLPDAKAEYYSINRDRRNAWWIGLGDGMRMYTPDFKLKKFLPAPQTFSGVAGYVSPFDDREGNLWFMTENGVDRIRETRLTVPEMPFRGMDFSLAAGSHGEVWVSGNTTLYDMAPRAFAIAPDGRRIPSTMPAATASTCSADGSQWFGNFKYVWQRRDGKVKQWPLPPAISGIDLQAMAMADDGSLWVSVLRRGVHTFKDGIWLAGGGHAELAKQTAVSLHADAQGRLWIGYVGNAIAMLQQGVIRHFGAAEGLAVGNALTMYSQRGTLWVGGDQGLARFDNGRFVMLNDSAGRPFTGVSGIVETKAGELWLHGASGLLRIGAADLAAVRTTGGNRVAAELFDHLDGHEGAPQLLRPLNTLVEAGDGRLWYTTVSSVGWIDPQRIARNALAPTPLITSLNTDQQRYPIVSGISLPENTRNLRIDFTAAVLSIPERARFRTRLIGQDHDWRDAGGLRQAFYTNLGPGDYRFEVIAANEDGLWSAAPASLSFHIAPAFYQTLWFRLMCAALLAGIAYLLYLRRLAYMTTQVVERMRTRLDERERIARTLHDTFLQSLHGLVLRFQSIKASLPKNDTVHQQIDAALDLADAVIDEGRDQIMDLRILPGNSDFHLSLEMAGREACAQHSVAFSLRQQGTLRALQAGAQEELYAIAKEAITNALRHSGSGEIAVELTYGETIFILAVRDYGKGIDEEIVQAGMRAGHWGMVGMQERARRIGGSLQMRSAANEGTTIVVTMRAGLAYQPTAGKGHQVNSMLLRT
jgi:signal transduction histidine kinase/ligand-binding sensor domain-containing protein